MQMTLSQSQGRIKKKKHFESIFKNCLKFGTRYCWVYVAKAVGETPKVAFVAGKKVGNSVKRNRAKRLLKEVYRKNQMNVKLGHDWIFIAKKELVDSSEAQLLYHVTKGLQAHDLWNA